MSKKTQLKEELERIAARPTVTGRDLGRFLLKSYRAVVDPSIEQVDRELYSRLEYKVYGNSYQREVYNCYKRLYLAIFPLRNRALMLKNSFMTAFDEFLQSSHLYLENTTERTALNSLPYIMTPDQKQKAISSAISNIQHDKRDSFIAEAFRYYKTDGKERVPQCISEELDKISDMPFDRNNRFADKCRVFDLKIIDSSGAPLSYDKEHYFEELKRLATKHTGNSDLNDYKRYCYFKKCELLFKGGKAIKEYALEQTGTNLRGKNAEIEELLQRLISACDYMQISDDDLFKLNNALGFEPQLKKVYKGYPESNSFLLLAYYTYSPEYLKTDYPSLYKAFSDMIDRGEAGEIGYYPLLKFSDTELSLSDYERIRKSGIAIIENPTSDQEEKKNNVYLEDMRAEKKEPLSLEGKLINLNYSLAYVNCYNIVIDTVCEVFKLNCIKDFMKVSDVAEEYKETAELYNKTIVALYCYLSTVYQGEELTEARKKFKEKFGLLSDFERLLPTQEAKDTVKQQIEKAFKTNDSDYRFSMFENDNIYTLMESIEEIR